jgi:thioredoxin 1
MMTDFLTSNRRKAAALIAVIPLTACFAGCAPSSTTFGGNSSAGPVDMSVGHAAANVDTHAQTSHHTPRKAETLAETKTDPPSPPPAELVSAYESYSRPFTFIQPKEKEVMNKTDTLKLAQGKVEHIGTDDFQQHVLDADVPVLVDFYAEWCGPCRKLAPVLDQVAQASPHAKVVKVNIDESPQLAAKFGVSSIPTLLVFRDGSAVAQHTGLADRQTLQRLLTR